MIKKSFSSLMIVSFAVGVFVFVETKLSFHHESYLWDDQCKNFNKTRISV